MSKLIFNFFKNQRAENSSDKNIMAEPSNLAPIDKLGWEMWAKVLNPNAPLAPVRVWATMGDRPAIPRKGIITLSAKPKQGKSLSTYTMLIPIITGRTFDTLKPSGERPRLVVVFDTSMDTDTLTERYRAMQKHLGEDYSRFIIVPLLVVPKSQRREIIEGFTNKYSPDIVVIDQVDRLVSDFNDPVETEEFGEWLTAYAKNRTVMTVISLTKTVNNPQMKGHLGSILEELAVENYSVSRKAGLFEVMPTSARKSYITEDSAPFTFAINDGGEIITADLIVEASQAKETEAWRDDLAHIFGRSLTLSYTDLVERLKELGYSDRGAKKRVENAARKGAIIKTGNYKRAPYRIGKADYCFRR